MIVVGSTSDLRGKRAALPEPVGLVPTMGFLHDGHLALVRRAREQNRSVAASIFVNPTQFAPHEDYQSYPRDLERDLRLLEETGVDLVFIPTVEEMYPAGFSTSVDVGPLARRLEGASRPGHFQGVATVVVRLFNIFQPQRAYFGQKDAQQTLVVKRMVADLGFSTEVVVVPTVREPDGLALSSRNVYLTPSERTSAVSLSAALALVQKRAAEGERNADELRQQAIRLIQAAPGTRIDYVSIADATTLEELVSIDRPALVSLAVQLGRARLIDNAYLD